MVSGQLLSDELILPDLPVSSSHPMDSSRILLGLMSLSRQAEAPVASDTEDLLEGVISRGVLRSLLSALHFRDVATVRHARRTARLAVGMAQYLGWDGRELKLLEVASLLHDIGKIGVPDNILFKPGTLSPDEAELMALHRYIGIDVLQACRVDKEVLEIISQSHNEYGDGANGLRRVGSEIHQGARILAVADAYDSLATEQVYRESKSHQEIMQILMDAAGSQFDGNVVCALARWVERDGLPFPSENHDAARPLDPKRPEQLEDALEASSLCHIFSYLYVLESLYDGFYLVDSDLRFVVWNTGAEKLLGHPSHEMLGQVWTSRVLCYADKYGDALPDSRRPMHHVIETGKPTTTEVQIQHWDGKWIGVEMQSVPLLNQEGQLQGVAEIFRDLSRSHRQQKEYRELKVAASRDALTEVANRGELETQLARMISDYAQQSIPKPFSIIFLDVDHFKRINDTYGHGVGDQVLMDIARLLQDETYSGELIGRYGGEEFVVLCPETQQEDAVRRAERLRQSIANAQIAQLVDFQVTVSLGVTEAEPGDSVESVFRRADKALYRAKERGRNRTCSLTNAILFAGEAMSEDSSKPPPDPWCFTAQFHACIAADMVVYKLGGFVSDNCAKLLEVTSKRAVLQFGSRGILPFWGSSGDRQPIELQIEFGDKPTTTAKRGRPASHRIEIDVTIRPIGWVRDEVAFQQRARAVLKLLRAYFAGE